MWLVLIPKTWKQPGNCVNQMKKLIHVLLNAKVFMGRLVIGEHICQEVQQFLQAEATTDEFHDIRPNEQRIYSFLMKHMSKYPHLLELCRNLLLSQGQAGVEGGFSVNKEVIPENRQTETLVVQRIVYDEVISCGGVLPVPISPELMKSADSARSMYREYIEQEKRTQKNIEHGNKRKRITEDIEMLRKKVKTVTHIIDGLEESADKMSMSAEALSGKMMAQKLTEANALMIKRRDEKDELLTIDHALELKESHPQKSRLEPNATEFLSNKAGDTTPPSDTGQWDGVVANDYQFANGEIGTGEQGGGITPPADSPIPASEFSAFSDSQTVFTNDSGISADYLSFPEGEGPLDVSLPDDQIRQLLKEQLEMYFSRENLANDSYLQSQMDADQYVPMATVANLSHIQQLTNSLDLIVEVLRESQCVQVDEKGEKVRPNHNRCIVILREIPDNTPVEDVESLFSGKNCPKFVSCEFAHNNNWYVTFDSDLDAQTAYQYLREEVQTFLNKPIMARIKAKPLIRMTYPRNGYVKRYIQPQQVQPAAPPEQQTTQQQFQVSPQITFVPSVQQYMQNGSQTIPFYPPSPAILPTWPPTSPTLIDPSMVTTIPTFDTGVLTKMLQMNGYHATSVKLNSTPNRHAFNNARNKNQKPHRQPNLDRIGSDGRMGHDRHPGSHRTSPRGGSDNSQISGPSHNSFQNRRGDNSGNHAHIVHSTPQSHMSDNNSNISGCSRQSEQQARKSYRSRRRQNEDGAKTSHLNSAPSSRDGRSIEAQFDLEHTSFPPLPGSFSNTATEDVFESKLSDVVRGTAKGQVREIKPTIVPQSSSTPVAVAPPKDNSNVNTSSNGVPTAVLNVAPSSSPPPPPPPPAQPPHPVSPQKSIKPSQPLASVAHTLPEIKNISPVATRATPVISPPDPENHSTPKQVHVSTHHAKMETEPVKLSYAQMVARGKDSDSSSDDGKEPVMPSSAKSNQTLKEQSHNDNTPSKDQTRKEFEPKEQRYTSARRAKENRERRRERERDGPKTLGN